MPGMRMSLMIASGCSRLSRVQHRVAAVERHRRHALLLERAFEHPPNRAVVIDDPDAVHFGSWAAPMEDRWVKTVVAGARITLDDAPVLSDDALRDRKAQDRNRPRGR